MSITVAGLEIRQARGPVYPVRTFLVQFPPLFVISPARFLLRYIEDSRRAMRRIGAMRRTTQLPSFDKKRAAP